ncbi:hypothetical protein AKO1_002205 [Acrasis kona]|uniref:1-aminocyclopropane-1-carboxylate deaminase n=1 Tax=Acrasis kona TaxID=1008807 RepID=A0AAW2ZIB6_9EUKA
MDRLVLATVVCCMAITVIASDPSCARSAAKSSGRAVLSSPNVQEAAVTNKRPPSLFFEYALNDKNTVAGRQIITTRGGYNGHTGPMTESDVFTFGLMYIRAGTDKNSEKTAKLVYPNIDYSGLNCRNCVFDCQFTVPAPYAKPMTGWGVEYNKKWIPTVFDQCAPSGAPYQSYSFYSYACVDVGFECDDYSSVSDRDIDLMLNICRNVNGCRFNPVYSREDIYAMIRKNKIGHMPSVSQALGFWKRGRIGQSAIVR